jgi:hypothetical protein
MNSSRTDRILSIIAVLLCANLALELYQGLVPPAHAGQTIDCNITGISNSIYNKLPVEIAEVNTSLRSLPVKVVDWETSDDVEVKVVDWSTNDQVKVKMAN